MTDHWKDQPRVPAGNPDGGRWTSSGKTLSRYTGESKQRLEHDPFASPARMGIKAALSAGVDPSVTDVFDDFDDNLRRLGVYDEAMREEGELRLAVQMMYDAVRNKGRYGDTFMEFNEDGNLVAALHAGWDMSFMVGKPNVLEIMFVGSLDRNAGARLVMRVLEYAAAEGAEVSAYSRHWMRMTDKFIDRFGITTRGADEWGTVIIPADRVPDLVRALKRMRQ